MVFSSLNRRIKFDCLYFKHLTITRNLLVNQQLLNYSSQNVKAGKLLFKCTFMYLYYILYTDGQIHTLQKRNVAVALVNGYYCTRVLYK